MERRSAGGTTIFRATVTNVISVNTYFYIDDATGHGFLIDPGAEAGCLLELIDTRGWTIEKILLTHGHYDHIGAAGTIREALGIPVLAHEQAAKYLEDPHYNLSEMMGPKPFVLSGAMPVRDGGVIALSSDPGFSLTAVYVPGHTEDSVMFLSEKERLAFVGDTIFKQTYGNCRFPGGNEKAILKSIRERILTLPDETLLLSGHTEATTVSAEKRYY